MASNSKVQWYSRLKASDEVGPTKGRALLDAEDLAPKGIVICQQLEHRAFTQFTTYLEYARYCMKTVAESHRCFYEVIFGDQNQKPYFDVDVKIGTVSNDKHLTIADAKELKRQIVAGILKRFDMIKPEDIMIFSSHSAEKYSYHIVVDNWCITDHEENRIFCAEVMFYVEERLGIFIDHLVYKTIQQLRIFQCHKYKSPRTKVFDESCEWKLKEKASSDLHKYAMILGGSLICNSSYCKFLPNLKPPEAPKKKWDGKETILEEEDPGKCMDILALFDGLKSAKDRLFPFAVNEIKGSLILLKRLMPSHCKICDRVHENEHPYLIVVGRERKIYFNCRRVEADKRVYVGKLGETDFVDSMLTEDQTELIIPELEEAAKLEVLELTSTPLQAFAAELAPVLVIASMPTLASLMAALPPPSATVQPVAQPPILNVVNLPPPVKDPPKKKHAKKKIIPTINTTKVKLKGPKMRDLTTPIVKDYYTEPAPTCRPGFFVIPEPKPFNIFG